MEKQSFTIYYNGKNVAVNLVEYDIFLAQITYTPIYIKFVTDENGNKKYIDTETNMETMLAKEIGQLIEKQAFSNA